MHGVWSTGDNSLILGETWCDCAEPPLSHPRAGPPQTLGPAPWGAQNTGVGGANHGPSPDPGNMKSMFVTMSPVVWGLVSLIDTQHMVAP